jgi:hypothetical protein
MSMLDARRKYLSGIGSGRFKTDAKPSCSVSAAMTVLT